jgi:hypothetical protein
MQSAIQIIFEDDFVCNVPIKRLFFIPEYWYKRVVSDLWLIKERFKQIKGYVINIFLFAPKLAICSDRSIIDTALRLPLDIDRQTIMQQCIIYLDIGTVLYDLGYQLEGYNYLYKLMEIYFTSEEKLPYFYALSPCFRFNRKKHWIKRKEYVNRLAERFPDNMGIKQLQVKSSIDLNELVDAETKLKELIAVHRDWGEFLQADLFFAHNNYAAAVDTYRKFKFPDMYHFWRPQYDYKEAVALFKINQPEKWRKKATKIGQRLAWDRFYRIDNLESEGVERISEIDEVINASKNDKRLFYSEQVFLFVKRFPRVIFELFFIYRVAVLYYGVGIIFLSMLVYAFAKRL